LIEEIVVELTKLKNVAVEGVYILFKTTLTYLSQFQSSVTISENGSLDKLADALRSNAGE
jgi:hypothetical protein